MRPNAMLMLIVAMLLKITAVGAPESAALQSSVIKRAAYDWDSQTLTVMFPSGAVYAYAAVPPAVFDALRSAPSPGVFFHAYIKTMYATRQLQPSGAQHQDKYAAGPSVCLGSRAGGMPAVPAVGPSSDWDRPFDFLTQTRDTRISSMASSAPPTSQP